jgi:hypothetical protein
MALIAPGFSHFACAGPELETRPASKGTEWNAQGCRERLAVRGFGIDMPNAASGLVAQLGPRLALNGSFARGWGRPQNRSTGCTQSLARHFEGSGSLAGSRLEHIRRCRPGGYFS